MYHFDHMWKKVSSCHLAFDPARPFELHGLMVNVTACFAVFCVFASV